MAIRLENRLKISHGTIIGVLLFFSLLMVALIIDMTEIITVSDRFVTFLKE